MRCADRVLGALSYHPRHVHGPLASAYWTAFASWQHDNGALPRRGGQWYLLELASRFRFSSIRQILAKSMGFACRRQGRDGGFQADCSVASACQVALAYARHGMLEELREGLRYDFDPLIRKAGTAFALKTRREALDVSRKDDDRIAKEIRNSLLLRQGTDGSWHGLVAATAQAVHDLLDCGANPDSKPIQKACRWLANQQHPLESGVFPAAPPLALAGFIYTPRVQEETAFERAAHPEYAWKKPIKQCLSLLPIYQTGAALEVLCRCGLHDSEPVEQGLATLFALRGPGGPYATAYWCACQVGRWVRARAPLFPGEERLLTLTNRPVSD